MINEKKFTIYRHVCRQNGKCYVGLTQKTWQKRWGQHVRNAKGGSGLLFHKAIIKYGPDLFDHEVLETVDTLSDANKAEERWVSFYKSNIAEYGYNLDAGGTAHNTHPDSRAKIGAAHKERWAAMSIEERSKAASKTNAFLTPEQRSILAVSNWESLPDEEKEKQVERLNSARTTEERSEAMRRVRSEETKEKRKERERKRLASRTPEQRSEANRKRAETMGHERMSDIAKNFTSQMTPEQFSERSQKTLAATTPEQRSERLRKSNAAITPDERKAIALRREAAKRVAKRGKDK